MLEHRQSDLSWNPLARWRSAASSARRQRPSKRLWIAVAELEPRVVPTLLGQSIFPADNPINQNIADAPTLANSGAIDNFLLNFLHSSNDPGPYDAGVTADWGAKFNVVHGNSVTWTPVQDWHEYGGNYTTTVSVPLPSNVVVCGENYGQPGSNYNLGADNHMIVWDEDNNILYETYHTARPTEVWSDSNGQHAADGQWHAANVTIINLNQNDFENATTAGGISFGAMMARPDEGLPVSQGGQGEIDHALYLELDNRLASTQWWTYPAMNQAGIGGQTSPNAPPYGLRMRLKASVDISSLDPQSQIIATALKNYGAIINDTYGNGIGMKIDATSYAVDANNQKTVSWNLGNFNLPMSDFEWVDLSPKVTGLSETSGQAGDTITITGQNFSYASPIDTINGTPVNSPGLSVLFGGQAATNVQVVNDTTITATVPPAPSGYGTVAVQVVSGVNDPGLGRANVNYPVFGYGASGQYVQFGYGNGPVQGDPSAPPAPTDLTATAGDGQVALNWSPTAGATSYTLYRGTVGGKESLLQSGVNPGYTDTTVTDGTTYYYQVFAVNGVGRSAPSNEVAVMPNPPAPVLDPSFESDSIITDVINSTRSELTGFSSYDWEQVAYSGITGSTYYPDPNWGASGTIAPSYEGSGNPHNPSAAHQGTIAGVWDPTTDNWAANSNPFPNGGYDGSQVAWVDGLTSGTTNYNSIVQQSSLTFQANTTYNLTVAVGARTDTAFGGYQIELEYGSIDPVTGVVSGTVVASVNSSQAPVAGGFGDITVNYTAPASGPMLGQNLLIVLATNPANNAYNPHTGPAANNAQVMPQTDFDNVRLTSQSQSSPWSDTDVGNPSQAGSSSYDPTTGTFTVSGGGTDIWNTSDQFHFVSQSITGDAVIVAQVASLTNTGTYAKAGLMIRDGTAANASYAIVFVTPDNGKPLEGANFEYRNGAGTASKGAAYTAGITAPEWLELVRQGDTFTAYYSSDGTNWTQDGPSETISMGSTVQVGLVVDAYSNTALNTATFTDVAVTGTAPSPPPLLPTWWSPTTSPMPTLAVRARPAAPVTTRPTTPGRSRVAAPTSGTARTSSTSPARASRTMGDLRPGGFDHEHRRR